MAETNSLPSALHNMTQREIERAIFDGASVSDPRGFSDAFTDVEILSLPDHPAWAEFDQNFRDWAMSAWDRAFLAAMSEED